MIQGLVEEGVAMGTIGDFLRNERIFSKFLTKNRNVRELFAVTMALGVFLRLAYIVVLR